HCMVRLLSAAALGCVSLCLGSGFGAVLRAQGTTSAAIGGRVVDERGRGLQGVNVVVRNEATGIAMRGVSRGDGRYLVSGLEVGGPYSVMARRLGSPM